MKRGLFEQCGGSISSQSSGGTVPAGGLAGVWGNVQKRERTRLLTCLASSLPCPLLWVTGVVSQR